MSWLEPDACVHCEKGRTSTDVCGECGGTGFDRDELLRALGVDRLVKEAALKVELDADEAWRASEDRRALGVLRRALREFTKERKPRVHDWSRLDPQVGDDGRLTISIDIPRSPENLARLAEAALAEAAPRPGPV